MYRGAFDLTNTSNECPYVHLNRKMKAQPDTLGYVDYKIFE